MKKDFQNYRLRILILVVCFICGITATAQSCYYNISQYQVEFSNSGGSQTISATLFGDCTAKISDNAVWITASINEFDDIVITSKPLLTGSRTASVYIKIDSNNTNTITVTQSGCLTLSWYPDTDGDTFGDANGTPIISCEQPTGYVNNSLDTCPTVAGTDNGCPPVMNATFSDENYIYTITPTVGTTNTDLSLLTADEKIESITYYDGLGRTMQQIGIKQSPDKSDIITHIEYDAFGRQAKEWLPYNESTGESGHYRGDISFNTQHYYHTNYADDFLGVATEHINPFSEKAFESSPLNRVLEQAAPGEDWALGNNHTIKFENQTNVTADMIRLFKVEFIKGDTQRPRLVDGGMYAPSQLYKSITKDENWKPNNYYKNEHTTQEFKDKQGRIIVKRTFFRDKWHDTYYVYDDFGNLTYVLPPKLNTYASLWQQDERIYGYYNNVFSLYEPGYQSSSNYMGYYAYNKRLYIYFGDWTGPGVALKKGEVFDLNLDFNIPDGPLVGNINITTSSGSNTYENNHYTASIKDGKLHLDGDATIAHRVSAYLYLDMDDFNIVPFNVSENQLDQLAYQYTYDDRNRLIEKKIPGKDWESIVYDKLDRPILTQDANLRETDSWLFTKYDVFGRVVYTGLMSRDISPVALQQEVNSAAHVNVSKTSTTQSIAGTTIYYTNTGYPTSYISKLYTINYYDDYNFDRDGAPSSITAYNISSTSKTKSLATGTKVRILDTNSWTTTVNYYDDKARAIYTYSKNNYLNTIDKLALKLDFTGNVLETKAEHKKDANPIITITDNYSYDHQGRLLSQKQKINDQEIELISKNYYDELGQLTKKDVGNTEASPLQELDYSYNIRGWLKALNNPGSTAQDNDLFSFGINYNKPNGPMNSSYYNNPLYNGNISHVYWQTNNSSTALRHYTYRYDAQNRFNFAFYAENDKYNNKYNAYIWEYDRNGNIQRLYRTGQYPNNPNYGYPMDYLNYTYQGNQLLAVKDYYGTNATSNEMGGFKDGNTLGDDYDYDANGNMTVDKNKEITQIKYNHLNLPVKISFDFTDSSNELDAGSIDYVYDATGSKLSKKVNRNSTIGRYTPEWTRYAGNFIYNENAIGETLQFFNHPEGYVEPDGKGAFNYVYQYKDHLGNIRLSYKDHDKDGKITGATTTVFSDDFESASGWDGSGASWGWPITGFDSDFKYQGNYSGEVKAPQGQSRVSHSNVWVPINNTEDTDYIYSAWAYSESPIIRLGLAMKEDGETGYLTLFDDIRVYITKKWVYIEKRVTVPAHITSLNIRIESAAWGNRVGSVWYDNVSIKKVNDTDAIEIVEENNYYPFGLKHKGYNNVVNGTNHKYGFGGKEEQDELGLGWIDITARNYDPALGRWMNLDPLAEMMRRHSPYNYAFNNPIFFIDYDGMMPCPTGDCDDKRSAFQRALSSKKVQNSLNKLEKNAKNIIDADIDFEPKAGIGVKGEVIVGPLAIEGELGILNVGANANLVGDKEVKLTGNVAEGKVVYKFGDTKLGGFKASLLEGSATISEDGVKTDGSLGDLSRIEPELGQSIKVGKNGKIKPTLSLDDAKIGGTITMGKTVKVKAVFSFGALIKTLGNIYETSSNFAGEYAKEIGNDINEMFN